MCQCTPERDSPPQFCRNGDCRSDYEQRILDSQPKGFSFEERGAYYAIRKDGMWLAPEDVIAALSAIARH